MPTLNRTYDGPLLAGENWGNSRSVDFAYDNNFWMTQLTVNKALTTHFARDDDGLLTEARVQGNTMSITRDPESGFVTNTSLANVDSSVAYNKYGETKSQQVDAPELSFAQDITRDALGRITQLTETIDGFETNYGFVYDDLGQLVEYEKNGEVFEYSYDVNGNRLSYTDPDGVVTEGVYDEQDRIETWGEWTYSHSEHGDLVQRFNDDTALTLHYDELGNLLQAEAAENDTNLTVDYKVDAMGRRVVRDSSTGDFREWVYQDALRPVAEIANGIFSQFVYANDGFGGAPDFMVRSATGKVYQFVKDHVGSVRFVIDANSGEVMQELQYDPFGRVLFDSNPGFQPFGFAGGLYDWETKLVRFGARDYDPGIGRWAAKDPVEFAGGQTNVYVYVGNDAVNFVDPTGLEGTFPTSTCVQSNCLDHEWAQGEMRGYRDIRGSVSLLLPFYSDLVLYHLHGADGRFDYAAKGWWDTQVEILPGMWGTEADFGNFMAGYGAGLTMGGYYWHLWAMHRAGGYYNMEEDRRGRYGDSLASTYWINMGYQYGTGDPR